MAPRHSKQPEGSEDFRAEAPRARRGKSSAPAEEEPPQRLRLGCAPLIIGIGVIALLGKILPHEPKRSPAAPAANAASQKAKSEVAPQTAADPAKKPPERKPDKTEAPEQAVVVNNPWNSSVRQVERHLKKSLYDAASFEVLEWSPVLETKNGYQVRCKYRSKNVLGIYVTQSKTFYLNKAGEVYAEKKG